MRSLGRGPVETPKTCTPVDARPEQPHGFQRNQSASFSERRIHRACAGWDAAAELRIQNIFDLGSGTFERDIEELHLAIVPRVFGTAKCVRAPKRTISRILTFQAVAQRGGGGHAA